MTEETIHGDEPGRPPGVSPGPELALATPASASEYRVLARKYRPATFDDLIGQEAMVRTLTNAFRLGRLHQAYLLTGVRGVGKTTTARILARAFNYQLPAHDGQPAVDAPTVHMPELGVHCQAIIDSRHIDVIEMDAASHTGVDDVREIIENARFKPVMARLKVYIIDEVHMLSKAAFNALLKTLEEPPPHVKFLLATTEVEKVPVTVRSRCLRFDLRRVETEALVAHLRRICELEKVRIDDEALAVIARVSEGSVRDSLSLLDQAIAHGSGAGHEAISAVVLREMLGFADRTRVIDMFESLMNGDIAAALGVLKEQYDSGADPYQALVGLAEFIHFVTRFKVAPDTPRDASMSPREFERGSAFARTLGIQTLTRVWQILTRGMQDMRDSPRPLAAADMVLVRIAHAAEMPGPEDVLRRLTTPGEAGGGPAPRLGAASPAGAPTRARSAISAAPSPREAPAVSASPAAANTPSVRLRSFDDVVALAATRRDIQLKMALEQDVRLVRFEEGSIEIALEPGASTAVAQNLMRRLGEWTGVRWMVAISREDGMPTLREQARAREAERVSGARAHPLVRGVLDMFPGAEIVAIRSGADLAAAEPVATPTAGDEEVAYIDQIVEDEDL